MHVIRACLLDAGLTALLVQHSPSGAARSRVLPRERCRQSRWRQRRPRSAGAGSPCHCLRPVTGLYDRDVLVGDSDVLVDVDLQYQYPGKYTIRTRNNMISK